MQSLTPFLAEFSGTLQTLPEQLVLGILAGSIYALIALGYTMVYGILKLINFAHGEIFMLGAYIGLFVSRAAIGNSKLATAIIAPDSLTTLAFVMMGVGALASIAIYVAAKLKHKDTSKLFIGVGLIALGCLAWVLAKYQPQAITLVVMMLASMAGCAVVGVTIEFFAYRPMRNQPRIAALITAIGVSLFIQFTGQLFLPNAPPPSITEPVNPYTGAMHFYLKPPPKELSIRLEEAEVEFETRLAEFDTALEANGWRRFDLPPEGVKLKEAYEGPEQEKFAILGQVRNQSIEVNVPTGQFIMFVTAILLMIALHHLVMRTKTGRSMRAVSHDFDSASLMGVNVNKIVTITFIIGSALAGAGAMMNATFLGTPLTSFYGLMPGVKAFVAAVLGGIGNIPGAVVGGLLMGVAEGLVVWAGYSSLKEAIAFVILIFILILRPGGILGSSSVEKV